MNEEKRLQGPETKGQSAELSSGHWIPGFLDRDPGHLLVPMTVLWAGLAYIPSSNVVFESYDIMMPFI